MDFERLLVCDEAKVVASLLLTKEDLCYEEFMSEADEGEKKDSECQRVCLCMVKGGLDRQSSGSVRDGIRGEAGG